MLQGNIFRVSEFVSHDLHCIFQWCKHTQYEERRDRTAEVQNSCHDGGGDTGPSALLHSKVSRR